MNIVSVNNDALSRAMIAVVGEEQAALITKAYEVIDLAMAEGFREGMKSAQAEAADLNAEAAAKEWGNGYDEGYLDGVGDARARPQLADVTSADIIAERERLEDPHYSASEDFDGDSYYYEGDSGDETN